MRNLYRQALTVMENAFRRLEGQVPPPQERPLKDGFVFRYIEQSIEQALLQKIARVISGLYAVDLLLLHGFVQEQAVLHRTLDELNEDILFLTAALTNDSITELHKQYLVSFYAEEFEDPLDPVASHRPRHIVPRKKIRAYLIRVLGAGVNSSVVLDNAEVIHKTYSGYVHGASPHIMDMCGGVPPRFHIRGMLGTPRIKEHVEDAWNYFYRGLLSVTGVAKALGDKPLVDNLYAYIAKFENASNTNFSDRAKTET